MPPSALSTEMSKAPQLYFGLNFAKTGQAPVPKWLSLGANHSLVAGKVKLSATEFFVNVTFSYSPGGHHYNLGWNVCLKDAVAEDGIGLPGHHGCGDPRVLYSAPYLG